MPAPAADPSSSWGGTKVWDRDEDRLLASVPGKLAAAMPALQCGEEEVCSDVFRWVENCGVHDEDGVTMVLPLRCEWPHVVGSRTKVAQVGACDEARAGPEAWLGKPDGMSSGADAA